MRFDVMLNRLASDETAMVKSATRGQPLKSPHVVTVIFKSMIQHITLNIKKIILFILKL